MAAGLGGTAVRLTLGSDCSCAALSAGCGGAGGTPSALLQRSTERFPAVPGRHVMESLIMLVVDVPSCRMVISG